MQLELVSWDGHNINDGANYESWFPRSTLFRLQRPDVAMPERIGDFPVWAQKILRDAVLVIEIKLLGTLHSQRDEIAQWFDVYDDSGLKTLIVQDTADSNRQWYVEADPIDFKPTEGSPATYTIVLAVPDPVWREVTEQSQTWNITGTGQTQNITARGNRPTPLRLRITPTANKSNDFGFEHLVHVRNPNARQLVQYPVDLTDGGWDTATIITATEMQADGDDLRVYVDGIEVDRWLADINTDHTKVWINLDLEPRAHVKLLGAFNIGDDTLEYAPKSLRGRFPYRNGCIRIDNEMIIYDKWRQGLCQFDGCQRGARGTTEANHAASTSAYKVDHHIKIVYGDSTLSAPETDDDYKPAFELDSSTNTSWVYAQFGDSGSLRSGRWEFGGEGMLQRLQTVDPYTGAHGASADPYTEMGLQMTKDNPIDPGDYWNYWFFEGQVPITNTSLEGDYKMDNASDVLKLTLQDRPPSENWREIWTQSFTTNVVWTAWGPVAQAPRTGTRSLRLEISGVIEGDASGDCYAEVQDATLTLDSNETPAISGPTTWSRIANPYHNLPRLTNNTTGEYIDIDFIQVLNQALEVDSEFHTVEYEQDESNQYQALDYASSWEKWLMADPGVNQIQIDETGVAAVTIIIYWRGRNS